MVFISLLETTRVVSLLAYKLWTAHKTIPQTIAVHLTNCILDVPLKNDVFILFSHNLAAKVRYFFESTKKIKKKNAFFVFLLQICKDFGNFAGSKKRKILKFNEIY
jgi:hypothetical protein